MALHTPGATAGGLTDALCSLLLNVFKWQVPKQLLCRNSVVCFFPFTHCDLSRATERGRQYSSPTVQGLKGVSRHSVPQCHQPLPMVQAERRVADSGEWGSVADVFLVEL